MSCNTSQKADKTYDNVNGTGAGLEQQQQILASFLSVQKMEKKFMILAIIENETGVTSFSKGDTVSLYPNFIRGEGEQMDKISSGNEHMNSLQNLVRGIPLKHR